MLQDKNQNLNFQSETKDDMINQDASKTLLCITQKKKHSDKII